MYSEEGLSLAIKPIMRERTKPRLRPSETSATQETSLSHSLRADKELKDSEYIPGTTWMEKWIMNLGRLRLQAPSIGMSAEELQICGELEMNVERGLEEEIKDGIYHFALRLHRLYQHQKERSGRKLLEQDARN
ncbi:hypothetical protein RJ639_035134 [Escallonia herrerae]|uniref:Uncharacterized protein n=1 Tax=Escallonia herrerae TaxID=1293975 RepID=A0AA88WNP7_9ASTE|nr:hypothetical protein RJ639_035134 [Escallonia herrerae]